MRTGVKIMRRVVFIILLLFSTGAVYAQGNIVGNLL